jgi:hypothetical protein
MAEPRCPRPGQLCPDPRSVFGALGVRCPEHGCTVGDEIARMTEPQPDVEYERIADMRARDGED